ncbi:RNA binding S1 domain protein [Thermanaerovibrio acidaminovorans DSM 6589]|uniref:RNA binding S1 domain protein n=1 Tax=Thermanaerovibrio acidaminovorans (strain ATCC 49978 / DSM 6589 / Su883) TaxID=525903 RepID=D1B5G8_THEAS|nr:RNA binding S1 domain protein [Thermanaerovibrio acidaminovorans DSM 6589]
MVDGLTMNNSGVSEPEPETMESIMEQIDSVNIHRGSVVEGTVVDAREDGWLVDVGYKCEGFLPRREWSHRAIVEKVGEPQVGDRIRVQVTNVGQGEEAQLNLSRWRCEFDERWNALEEKLAQSDVIEVEGIRKVKGGLIVDCCGLEGFIPISHLAEEGRGINPANLVGKTFPVKLVEKDRRKRRLVLSRRSILDEEMASLREEFYANVHEGDILEGEVSSITSFGVFVNLGAMEGLVHITELSWQRGAKAKDLVQKGDKVKVKVIGIDRENNRVSLSLKQAQEDPWVGVTSRWTVGQRTKGVVTNLADFGAFVEIEPGVEGLIHIGDLSWSRVKHPKEVLKKGQEVEVVILEVDGDRRRIGLGLKQLNDPWANVSEKYSKDQVVTVKVVRLADFGAFVEIEDGVEGLIHISQLSRQRVEKPSDVLREGQEVQAKILEVNPSEKRIRLSLRALEEPTGEERHEERREERRRRPAREDHGHSRQQGYVQQQEEFSFTIGDHLNLNR